MIGAAVAGRFDLVVERVVTGQPRCREEPARATGRRGLIRADPNEAP